MTTSERELTRPVDLCTADGSSLNPDARGWSRHPLHRANLDGRFGMNKRWDYWAILAGDLVVSSLYSDVDHFGLADVYWADLVTGESGGRAIVVPHGDGIELPRARRRWWWIATVSTYGSPTMKSALGSRPRGPSATAAPGAST